MRSPPPGFLGLWDGLDVCVSFLSLLGNCPSVCQGPFPQFFRFVSGPCHRKESRRFVLPRTSAGIGARQSRLDESWGSVAPKIYTKYLIRVFRWPEGCCCWFIA
jgi:hypothetical protein